MNPSAITSFDENLYFMSQSGNSSFGFKMDYGLIKQFVHIFVTPPLDTSLQIHGNRGMILCIL